MKEISRQGFLTVKEWSSTKMDKFSRVLSSKTNGYLAKILFQTGPITKAPSETIWLMVTVNFTGRMESNTQGNGK